MEPLSLVASIITISGTIGAGLKAIRTAQAAPEEVQALANEVTDITAVACDIEAALTSGRLQQQSVSTGLATLLDRANATIQDLDITIKSHLVKFRSHEDRNKAKVSRLSWVKQRSRVSRLQMELREIRLNLAAYLGVINLSQSSRIELELQNISAFASEARAEQTLQHDKLVDNLHSFDRRLDLLDQRQGRTDTLLQDMRDLQQEFLIGIREELRPFSLARSAERMVGPAPPREALLNQSEILIQAYNVEAICDLGCTCSCHCRQSFRTPSVLNGLLGSLFIGYSGLPLVGGSCDKLSCRRKRRGTSTTFNYYFPRWFLLKAIHLTVKNSALRGPEAHLRVSRVVWDQAEIFWHSINGDIDKIKSLFESGLASPNDVAFIDNYSPLLYAVLNLNVSTCKFLLDAGADPSIEPKFRGNAMECAWDIIMGKNADDATINAFRSLFNCEMLLEDQAFTGLHNVVLGLRSGSIEDELLKAPSMIDKQDSRGRTALWWAARRGDDDSVRYLLEHGASPDICDEQDVSPLWCATLPNSPACLQLLLEGDAKIIPNKIGYNPLHQVSAAQDDPRYMALLLPYAESIDPVTNQGDTPLTIASQWGKYNIAAFLLDAGAKANGAYPTECWTPLTSAISGCKSNIVELLLSRGADYRIVSPGRQNILHSAAMFADREMFDTLSKFNLYGIERDLKDKFDMSPYDYFQRLNASDDLVIAFDNLLRKIRDATPPDNGPNESDIMEL